MRFKIFVDFRFYLCIFFVCLYLLLSLLFWLFIYTRSESSKVKTKTRPTSTSQTSTTSTGISKLTPSSTSLPSFLSFPLKIMETTTATTTTAAATSTGSAAQSTTTLNTAATAAAAAVAPTTPSTTTTTPAAAATFTTTTPSSTLAAISPAQLGATTPAAGLAGSSSSTYAGGGGGGGGVGSASASNASACLPAVTAASNSSSIVSSNTCSTYQPLQLLQPQQQQQTTLINIESSNDFNNTSMASGVSEGQRSLSGAPSASSSPILSPPGKIFGRNANGTLVSTSRPGNEAEIQLYRVLQRASLLSYYDTLLEMGGDDVQQLYEAGEEEFLEIMALVGMATKPLHVRRLQKVLHEWASCPALFQGPMVSTPTGLCETPTKSSTIAFNTEYSASLFAPRVKTMQKFSPTPMYNPTPLIQTVAQQTPTNTPKNTTATTTATAAAAAAAAAHLLTHGVCSPAITVPVIQSQQNAAAAVATLPPLQSAHAAAAAALAASALAAHQNSPSGGGVSGGIGVSAASTAASAATCAVGGSGSGGASTAHQVTSSSPQLTPVLTEMQVSRITHGAEKIANQLPQREPRAQTSKKRTSRELEQVIAMSEHDPRRMDEIRKYSAIYGRFDCKRRPEKPLTLHEVCVNEAAAQLCRLVPALLTRRDELFPLARQIVKDAGFGHSASIARYGGLLSQVSAMQAASAASAAAAAAGVAIATPVSATFPTQSAANMSLQRSSVLVDCESSDSTTSFKRQRLSPTEMKPTQMDLNRDFNEDSRYNLFAMYQKFAKPPFDLTDIAKFSLAKTDFDDNDNDSRFSFSNSSNSPTSMPHNGNGESETDIGEHLKFALVANASSTQQQQRALENEVQSSGSNTTSPCHSSNNRQVNTLYVVENNAAFGAANSSSNNSGNGNANGGVGACYSHQHQQQQQQHHHHSHHSHHHHRGLMMMKSDQAINENSPPSTPFGGGVQVISAAAAGHIIAVANPALALSPTLSGATVESSNLKLTGMKRENEMNED